MYFIQLKTNQTTHNQQCCCCCWCYCFGYNTMEQEKKKMDNEEVMKTKSWLWVVDMCLKKTTTATLSLYSTKKDSSCGRHTIAMNLLCLWSIIWTENTTFNLVCYCLTQRQQAGMHMLEYVTKEPRVFGLGILNCSWIGGGGGDDGGWFSNHGSDVSILYAITNFV